MALACRFCIMTRGLKGSEIASLPRTDEQLFEHIEREHHIPVRREGETPEQCRERFYRENPEAADPATCRCPACQESRRAAPAPGN
jgi:hypothetical protein